MERKDYLQNPVKHIKINSTQTVDQLMLQFKNSGSLGAGRLATACDIYENMLKDKDCTVFLALSGAVIPAGMRTIVTDLIRKKLVDVIVTTGACMVHDAIEAVGGHHYRASWTVNDVELYKYHLFRIYDILVPEEDYVRLDFKLSQMYDDIATERQGESLASNEFSYEIGKRLTDEGSILELLTKKTCRSLCQLFATQNLGSFIGCMLHKKNLKMSCYWMRLKMFQPYVEFALNHPRTAWS